MNDANYGRHLGLHVSLRFTVSW